MSQIAATGATPQTPVDKTQIDKTAREFEAVFLGQMTRLMMESVEQDGPFSGGHGEEMFRGVLAEKMGEEMAKGRGLGIASAVSAEMIRIAQSQQPQQENGQ